MMNTKIKNITEEQALAWRKAYEEGKSPSDLAAMEAAKGRRTSRPTIQKAIVAVGGTMRTQREGILLSVANREKPWWSA